MKHRKIIVHLALWAIVAGVFLSCAAAAAQNPADAAPAAAAAKAPPPAIKETERMSILELFVRGGWFMVPIGACSLLAVTFIAERLLALRHAKIIPPGFLDALQAAYRTGGRKTAMDFCRARDNPMARMALAGLRKLHRGEKEVELAIEDAGANEVSKLRRNLRMLYAISAVAPMLGLLGTVWGMIQAFQVASQQGLGRATSLAKGIYEALVTTFGGLIVAIPVLIFYYFFLGKIERIVHEMNDKSVELIEGTLMTDDSPEAAPARREPAEATA